MKNNIQMINPAIEKGFAYSTLVFRRDFRRAQEDKTIKSQKRIISLLILGNFRKKLIE